KLFEQAKETVETLTVSSNHEIANKLFEQAKETVETLTVSSNHEIANTLLRSNLSHQVLENVNAKSNNFVPKEMLNSHPQHDGVFNQYGCSYVSKRKELKMERTAPKKRKKIYTENSDQNGINSSTNLPTKTTEISPSTNVATENSEIVQSSNLATKTVDAQAAKTCCDAQEFDAVFALLSLGSDASQPSEEICSSNQNKLTKCPAAGLLSESSTKGPTSVLVSEPSNKGPVVIEKQVNIKSKSMNTNIGDQTVICNTLTSINQSCSRMALTNSSPTDSSVSRVKFSDSRVSPKNENRVALTNPSPPDSRLALTNNLQNNTYKADLKSTSSKSPEQHCSKPANRQMATGQEKHGDGEDSMNMGKVSNKMSLPCVDNAVLSEPCLQSDNKITTPAQIIRLDRNIEPCAEVTRLDRNIKPCAEVTRFDSNIEPCAEVIRLDRNIEPCAEVTRLDRNIEPCAEVTRLDSNIEPCAEVTRLDRNIEPGAEVTRFDSNIEPPVQITRLGSNIEACSEVTRLDRTIEPCAEVTRLDRTIEPCAEVTRLDR
ncbi:unnamed protein product, partial [Lymnaea stagnalis]